MQFGEYYLDVKKVILVSSEEDKEYVIMLGHDLHCYLTSKEELRFMGTYLNQEKP